MKEFGLIGRTLSHSFSVAYFTNKFQQEGLPYTYSNFELEDICQLDELLRLHPNLCGFNVTIPYKEAILPYLSLFTPEAKAAQAVNTVKVKDGRLWGHNTDIIGFGEALDRLLNGNLPLKALILGTGGASKAVEAALKQRHISYAKVSRIAGKADFTYNILTESIVKDHKLLINCTPLGTSPNIDDKPDIPYTGITEGHFAFDLVYNPSMTTFMRSCAEHGAKICNGLNMLHLQAEAAWEWWNNER